MTKKRIEIIVPCYNEQECVDLLYSAVEEVFKEIPKYDFSLLLVNDGSKDLTFERIKALTERVGSEKVKYISFARNFGKEAAIYAGFKQVTGDYVVLMDADLQHPPKLMIKMIEEIEKGADCCAARRVSRTGEPVIRSFFSNMFYYMINKVTAIQFRAGETDYRMMTRAVAEAIATLPERERFTKGIYSWIGFNTTWIEYENVERAAGETKWSFAGLIHYAVNGFIAFATTPLRGVIWLGFLIVIVSFIYAGIVLWGAIQYPESRTGYSSLMIILLFLGGVIITILGVIGEYLARIYLEVKKRPLYIIKDKNL